jgi:hypothetical protein
MLMKRCALAAATVTCRVGGRERFQWSRSLRLDQQCCAIRKTASGLMKYHRNYYHKPGQHLPSVLRCKETCWMVAGQVTVLH